MHCLLCILCMPTLLTQQIKASNALYVVYVDTVNTRDLSTVNAMLCISIQSKLVFVAFTQYCIQCILLTLYTGPLTPPRGKACTAFHLVGLAIHQSKEAASLTFLSNYKGNCRQDAQPIPNS